jgi:hypothetical protein
MKYNLIATHGLPTPEFRESRMCKQDSKIAIRKTMPGHSPTMGSIIRSSPTKWMGLA